MKKIIVLLIAIGIYLNCNAQTKFSKANGLTIAYESFGSIKKETILLISGTNEQLTTWPVDFCEQLANRGYRVIRFDNRDIGLSSKFDKAGLPDWAGISKAIQEKSTPPLPYTLDDMAKDAISLLNALNIKKAHIVGVSMGGMIAQRVAYNHPEYTLSLASIMAGGGNATFPLVAKPDLVAKIPQLEASSDTIAYIQRELKSKLILAGTKYQPNSLALLENILKDVKRSYYPDGFLRQGAVALAGFYAGKQDALKTITAKTVIIHGDEDPMVVVEAAKDVAENIPESKFEIIKGMGHSIGEPFFKQLIDLIVLNAKKE